MTESRAGWSQDAADDIKAPSIGAIVRWAGRAAKAKAAVGIADRTLAHLLRRAQDVYIANLARTPESMQEAVMKHAPLGEIIEAERALADAIEAEEFAARISSALEVRRARIAADDKDAKPPLRTVQGGRR